MVRLKVANEVEPAPSTEGRFRVPPEPASGGNTNHIAYEIALVTVSWIPATMYDLWGLPETDDKADWGPTTTFGRFIASDNKDEGIYRFTNILIARVVVDNESKRIIDSEYLSSDANTHRQYQGMSIARSFLGTKVELIAHEVAEPPTLSSDRRKVTFQQVAICRTRAPEILSSGAAMAFTSSASSSSIAGLISGGFSLLIAAVGAGLSALATAVVGQAISFAPIWTALALEVDSDGGCDFRLKHSHFPSTTLYVRGGGEQDFKQLDYVYDGTAPNRFECWVHRGWDFSPESHNYDFHRRSCSRTSRVNALFGLIKRANYRIMPSLVRLWPRHNLETHMEARTDNNFPPNDNPVAMVVPYKSD